MKILELIPEIRNYPVRRFRRGSTIVYQGEVPRSAYIVKTGAVKVYNINSLGEEQIITFEVEGDIFPSQWSFQFTSNALYYYEALGDCELYALPRAELLEHISSNPVISQHIMNYFLMNYTSALMRVAALEQAKAADKIMHTLYYLVTRYGVEDENGIYAIELALSHQLIADMVGLTRETASLELSKLKKQGIIEYKAKRYIVKREKLVNIIGEDNFKEMSGKA